MRTRSIYPRASLFLVLNLFFLLPELAPAGQENVFTTAFESGGLQWSRKLREFYSNGCDEKSLAARLKSKFPNYQPCTQEITIKDSDAARACSSFGARLPTQDEVYSLIRSFEYTEGEYGPQSTAKALQILQQSFGIQEGDRGFWTSTVHRGRPGQSSFISYAFFFEFENSRNPFAGSVEIADLRTEKNSVICVRPNSPP